MRLVLGMLWWIIDVCVPMNRRKHKSTFSLCLQRYQVHAKGKAQVWHSFSMYKLGVFFNL